MRIFSGNSQRINSFILEMLYYQDKRTLSIKMPNLSGANLRGTQLGQTCLRGTNLRGADLTDTDLRHANLDGADLTEDKLINTCLQNVVMRGANFTDADLTGSDIEFIQEMVKDSIFCRTIMPDGSIYNGTI